MSVCLMRKVYLTISAKTYHTAVHRCSHHAADKQADQNNQVSPKSAHGYHRGMLISRIEGVVVQSDKDTHQELWSEIYTFNGKIFLRLLKILVLDYALNYLLIFLREWSFIRNKISYHISPSCLYYLHGNYSIIVGNFCYERRP